MQTNDSKVFDGFDNFVSRVGLNNDNTLSAGMYTFNLMTRNRVQLEAAYRGSWVTGIAVDAVAEDMTRAGIEIQTHEASKDINELQKELKEKCVWSSLCSNIKWGRLYGGSIAVIQIDGQDLASPLNIDRIGRNQFKGLAVYDRWQLQPDLVNLIQTGPEIGLPEYYSIVTVASNLDPIGLAAKPVTGQIRVHHSRCIRSIGIELPFFQSITEMMWGESILERFWDRLIAFDTATMSSANLIERANNRTIGVENLREIIAAGGKAQQGLEAMFDMIRTFQTNEGLTILDKNDTFQTTNYTFTGLDALLLQFAQQLSGSTGIPLVRFYGQSPAGLGATGDSDIRLYYDNINSQQNSKLRNGIEKLLAIAWRSKFGVKEPNDLSFSFTPLWQMSAMDKATISKTNSDSILSVEEAGIISRATAMKELRQASGDTGIFSNITDEDIAEAEMEPTAPVPEDIEVSEEIKPKVSDKVKDWLRKIRG